VSEPTATGGPRPRPRQIPRFGIALVVAGTLVGVGLIDHALTPPSSPAAAAPVVAQAAPVGAESSSWYCVGGTGPSGGSPPIVDLVNSSSVPVSGTVTAIGDPAASASSPVTVPAHGQVSVSPAQLVGSTQFVAADVDLEGGGVVASESVAGPTGWAQTPCASNAATSWYFAAGDTSTAYDFLSLYNPDSTPAVVDLTFVIGSKVTSPTPFQGLIVPPGRLVVAGVDSYVQEEPQVATVATARSGRVVAAQLLQYDDNGLTGLSVATGTPVAAPRWSFPRSNDVSGGSTMFEVFNPGTASAHVTVRLRLPSGPVAPLRQVVPPASTWTLDASSLTRLPANTDYAASFSTAGGPGVVVWRLASAPAASVAPQWGAVPGVAEGPPATSYVLPAAGTPALPATTGAAPVGLGLLNSGTAPAVVSIDVYGAHGPTPLAGSPVHLDAGAFTVIQGSSLPPTDALLVTCHEEGVSVMEDFVPAGMAGLVAQPGVALTPP